MHERPGVYSSYDASTVVSAGRAAKVIGVAAKAVKGTAGEVVTLTGYAAGVAAFGEDAADTPGMSTILRLLFANGASTVAAVRVAEAGAVRTTRTPSRPWAGRRPGFWCATAPRRRCSRRCGLRWRMPLPPGWSGSPWWAATVSRQRSW